MKEGNTQIDSFGGVMLQAMTQGNTQIDSFGGVILQAMIISRDCTWEGLERKSSKMQGRRAAECHGDEQATHLDVAVTQTDQGLGEGDKELACPMEWWAFYPLPT